MTVKELIERLEQVEDKEQDVIDGECNLVNYVYQDEYGVMIC